METLVKGSLLCVEYFKLLYIVRSVNSSVQRSNLQSRRLSIPPCRTYTMLRLVHMDLRFQSPGFHWGSNAKQWFCILATLFLLIWPGVVAARILVKISWYLTEFVMESVYTRVPTLPITKQPKHQSSSTNFLFFFSYDHNLWL